MSEDRVLEVEEVAGGTAEGDRDRTGRRDEDSTPEHTEDTLGVQDTPAQGEGMVYTLLGSSSEAADIPPDTT